MASEPFSLLQRVFGDPIMSEVFSEKQTVASWLRVEAALATAQGELGMIPAESAERIAEACTTEGLDLARLWDETTNVGYPILPLVRAISDRLPEGPNGHVHFGATTQDIMDSGLSLQLSAAHHRLTELVQTLGDRLAGTVEAHATTLMAGRTHAQQALPVTFGGKLAVFLGQVSRLREDLERLRPRIAVVSLHGAAGTSAGFGDQGPALRSRLAELLHLEVPNGPWHVARDGLAEYGGLCARLSGVVARLGREVIDLSRSELGEVAEQGGHHRGASSTMPQKTNPIDSETALGFAISAATMTGALYRAMEAGHERSAGEWQVEWEVIPRVSVAAASAVLTISRVVEGLVVHSDRMAENLALEQGRILSEAYMLALAPTLGREEAHDLVYEAATRSREQGLPLLDVLRSIASSDIPEIAPSGYIGESEAAARTAVAAWRENRPARLTTTSERTTTS